MIVKKKSKTLIHFFLPVFCFLFCFLTAAIPLNAQNIKTIAGTGFVSYCCDGGPAISAQLSNPYDVEVDASGNVYIADAFNYRIRKIDTSGVITTIAGTGTQGYSGDGGPAISAQLSNPTGVEVDVSGNVYIADVNNHCIRKIDPSGIITTIAGTGTLGYSGDGGPAASAQLYSPTGVEVDASGNVYITDKYNHRIRKIDTSGIITTISGTGTAGYSGDGGPAISAQLSSPSGVEVDASGNVYIADFGNHRIRKIDTSGIITTIAGTVTAGYSGDGGPAISAQLSYPFGVEVDATGNVYIADYNNNRIRKIDTSGIIITIAGTGTYSYSGDGGPAISATLNFPYGVEVDAQGNVYIADVSNHRIRKIDTSGIITTIAGTGIVGYSGDGGPATSAQLNSPTSVKVDASRNVYIADKYNNCIRKIDTAGIITTIAGTGTFGYSGDGGPATSAQLYYPTGVELDAAGNVYIADKENNRIRKIDTTGIITTIAGTGTGGYTGDDGPATSAQLTYPSGVEVDAAGNVYIADEYNNRIRKIDTDGIITTIAGTGTYGYSGDGGPATSADLSSPSGVKVDAEGNVYIADQNKNRIRKIDTAGIITTIAGTGTGGYSGDGGPATAAQLNYPKGVEVDAAGNVYIADKGNNRIRKIDTAGIITTIAGTGTSGNSGDLGLATAAQLYYPTGVEVDAVGNVYIADSYNHRIRKIDYLDGTCSFAITSTITNLTCNNICNGSINLTPLGGISPYTYKWSNGATTQNIDSLCAGYYAVTITDTKNCQTNTTITITEPNPITIVLSKTESACEGVNNGTASVSAYGDAPINSYLWSTGATITSINGLSVGNYTVQITDSVNCKKSKLFHIYCDLVWPGDINGDLRANHYDLLSLGMIYGLTGTPRDSVDIKFEGKESLDWSKFFKSGRNQKHGDCNGDGSVNKMDAVAIKKNFGKSYGKSSSVNKKYNSSNPDLYFQVESDDIAPGTSVEVSIMVGRDTVALYGIGFEIKVDVNLIDPSTMQLTWTNSWLGTEDVDMLTFDTVDVSTGDIFVACVRTDFNTNTSYGEVARMKFNIRADTTLADTAKLNMIITSEEGGVATSEGDSVVFNDAKDTLNINPTSIRENTLLQSSFKIYPNPTDGTLQFIFDKIVQIEKISVLNSLGQVVYEENKKNCYKNNCKIELPDIENGIYSIRVKTLESTYLNRFTYLKK